MDAAFVEMQEVPFHFTLGGHLWKAQSADPKSRIVRAVPARSATAPAWHSFGGLDIPFETAQEVGRLLTVNELPGYLDAEAAAVADPRDPRRLVPEYDTGDHLHLSPAGYRAMADAIDLSLFAR